MNEKEMMELSATFIQSAFRGYVIKNKLETFLYNYKSYNKGLEQLFNIFISIIDKKINLIEEKKAFLNKLLLINKQTIARIKSTNTISCKTYKLSNFPISPLTEKDTQYPRHYLDLYLHKEIGERFNIIKQNKAKELEKKYKEELDGINNKMNQLIEENKKLKDINDKNKYKEDKFKELSIDNKKKEALQSKNSTEPIGHPTAPSYASSMATRFSSRVTRSSSVRSSSGSSGSSAVRNCDIIYPVWEPNFTFV